MPITASAGQQAAIPTTDSGSRTLSSSYPLSSSALTHTAIDISTTNLFSVSVSKFGTLTGDCTLDLQVSIDGGSNYRTFKTYTNAQIAAANGILDTITAKGTHARFVLAPGTMTGSNGVNCRFYV